MLSSLTGNKCTLVVLRWVFIAGDWLLAHSLRLISACAVSSMPAPPQSRSPRLQPLNEPPQSPRPRHCVRPLFSPHMLGEVGRATLRNSMGCCRGPSAHWKGARRATVISAQGRRLPWHHQKCWEAEGWDCWEEFGCRNQVRANIQNFIEIRLISPVASSPTSAVEVMSSSINLLTKYPPRRMVIPSYSEVWSIVPPFAGPVPTRERAVRGQKSGMLGTEGDIRWDCDKIVVVPLDYSSSCPSPIPILGLVNDAAWRDGHRSGEKHGGQRSQAEK